MNYLGDLFNFWFFSMDPFFKLTSFFASFFLGKNHYSNRYLKFQFLKNNFFCLSVFISVSDFVFLKIHL